MPNRGVDQWSSGRRAPALRLFLAALTAALVFAAGLPAASSAYIYVDNNENVARVNLDGTALTQNFAVTAKDPAEKTTSSPCGEAVDSSHLYIANGGYHGADSIERANLDGTGATGIVTGAQYPCGIAVDATHIYWANSNGASGTTLGRANLDGTGAEQNFIVGASVPIGVAVDSTYIYWGNSATKSIGRARLDRVTSPEPEWIKLPGEIKVSGVAVSGGYIYWTSKHANLVGRASTSTGQASAQPEFIHTGEGTYPCGVAVDSGHVYWASNPKEVGAIGRAPLSGGTAEPGFVTGLAPAPCGIAVDNLGPGGSGGGGAGGGGGGSGETVTPPTTCNPILGTCSPELVVCVGLWTSVCPGPLPAPPPVLTCVSLFQSCAGFGSLGGSPGMIEMSGFPSSLTTSAACHATSGASAARRAHASSGPIARTAETRTGTALQSSGCLIRSAIEATDPSKANQALDYAENLQSFRNVDISAVQAELYSGLEYLCSPGSGSSADVCATARVVRLAIVADLEETLRYAGEAGKGVKPISLLPASVCASISPPTQCVAALTAFETKANEMLQALATRKHELGLDLPPPSASGARTGLAAAARRTIKRPTLVVIASGYAVVAQGQKSKLVLRVGSRMRALLRRRRAHGTKLIAARETTQGSVIPGVQSLARRGVTIRLVKPPKKKKR